MDALPTPPCRQKFPPAATIPEACRAPRAAFHRVVRRGTGLAIAYSRLRHQSITGDEPMATKRKGASGNPLAIELLEADHRKVEALFDQYEDGKEGGEETKRALAEKICGELKVHAQVEEELLYPWLKDNLDEENMELVEEAYVEHASAKDLITQLESAGYIDETFDAKVKVQVEYIKHN